MPMDLIFYFLCHDFRGTVGHKSHDPCFLFVFLMEAGVMTCVSRCSLHDYQ